MIKEIVKDTEFLKIPLKKATNPEEIKQIKQDLLDTANAHKDVCAGLCANQIGYNKSIICVRKNNSFETMVNPRIIGHCSKTYISEEGCLSLDYTSKVTRYHIIRVMYISEKGTPAVKELRGSIARIVQHEIDHCNGILI